MSASSTEEIMSEIGKQKARMKELLDRNRNTMQSLRSQLRSAQGREIKEEEEREDGESDSEETSGNIPLQAKIDTAFEGMVGGIKKGFGRVRDSVSMIAQRMGEEEEEEEEERENEDSLTDSEVSGDIPLQAKIDRAFVGMVGGMKRGFNDVVRTRLGGVEEDDMDISISNDSYRNERYSPDLQAALATDLNRTSVDIAADSNVQIQETKAQLEMRESQSATIKPRQPINELDKVMNMSKEKRKLLEKQHGMEKKDMTVDNGGPVHSFDIMPVPQVGGDAARDNNVQQVESILLRSPAFRERERINNLNRNEHLKRSVCLLPFM